MEAANSHCVIRLCGRPDRPRFQRAQPKRSEERDKERGRDPHHRRWRYNHHFQADLVVRSDRTDASEIGMLERRGPRLDLQRMCAQVNRAFSFAFFSINDTINYCPLLSDVNAVAADASSTVNNVVVFKETTNSVATVSGLCPLLH